MNALNAAVGGNLSAGATQFVQMGVANYLQQEGATLLGKWTHEGKLTEGSPLHAALHGAVGCLGAAAGGGDCGAGGMGAATSSLLTNLFTDQPNESFAEKEAKRDIIVGLTTAMALGTNLDPGTAMNSAISGVDNNYLTSAQVAQKSKELEACQSSFCRFRVESKWTGVDIGQEVAFDAGVLAGVPAGLHETIDGVVKMLGNPGETYEALRLLLNSDDLLGNVSDAVKQSFRDRLDKMDEEYLKGGAEGAFNSGMETGKLFMDIAGLLTGAGGAVKTTAMATEKVIARIVALKGAGRGVVGRGLDQAGNAAKAGDDLVDLGRETDLPEHRDSTAGRETGQDNSNLIVEPSVSVLQQKSLRYIDDLATQFNDSAIHPNSFQLSFNGKTVVADPELSLGAPVFKGVTGSDVMSYFKQLAGVDNMPSAKVVAGKGKVYSVKVKEGPSAGSTLTLRDFSTSFGKTGAKWTIDVITPSINGGRRVEVKFK